MPHSLADPLHDLRQRVPLAEQAWEAGLRKLNPTPAQLEHGLRLHRDILTLDTFSFLPSVWSDDLVARLNRLVDAGVSGNDWHFQSTLMRQANAAEDPAAAELFLNALALSGLNGMVQTVAEGKTRDEDIRRMAACGHVIRTLGHRLGQAATAGQVRRLREEGRFACLWSCNGPPLAGALRDPEEEFCHLETWRHLGVRLMHLTYNRRNFAADGCAEAANAGLSDLGRELIARMNRLGIVVDLAHTGEQSSLEAAAASAKPVIASHTACRGLFEHIRAKSDRVLKAIADTGGMVGIVGLASFLGRSGDIHALLDHVDYAVKLLGIDHVGIATDSTYQGPWPEGLKRPNPTAFRSQWWGAWNPQRDHAQASNEHVTGSLAWTNWPLFTVGLVSRGYSDADIEKLLGLNLLRVLEANE